MFLGLGSMLVAGVINYSMGRGGSGGGSDSNWFWAKIWLFALALAFFTLFLAPALFVFVVGSYILYSVIKFFKDVSVGTPRQTNKEWYRERYGVKE